MQWREAAEENDEIYFRSLFVFAFVLWLLVGCVFGVVCLTVLSGRGSFILSYKTANKNLGRRYMKV